MKKKLMILFIVIILSLGTVQVYATTILDTNIISLITNSIDTIISYYKAEAISDTENLNNEYKAKIGQYVNNKTNQVNDAFDTHVNIEIERANEDLNAFYRNLTQETDVIVDRQLQLAKESLTDSINDSVEIIKSQLEKELEKEIKEKLK